MDQRLGADGNLAQTSKSAVRTDDLWRLDAVELAGFVRQGDVSAREATVACLSRAAEVNPKINAVTQILEAEALREADAADAARQRGDTLGPLHGVPVTTKINVDQRGLATDNGLVAGKDLIATSDNPVVANLRAAGAIIIGRTNAPPFSMRWFTENDLHGRTKNPHAEDHTPGGSSGGAASAVAAGISPIAHGNDIAGSIRYPAYCCGVAGLRPSFGRIPSFNATSRGGASIATQLMAVQGPLARSMRDLRLGYQAMAVPHVSDPRTFSGGALPRLDAPLHAALVSVPEGMDVHPAIRDAIRRAGDALAQAGYIVEEVSLPEFAMAAELWPRIAVGDLLGELLPWINQLGDEKTKVSSSYWAKVWPGYDAKATVAALAERSRLLHVWGAFQAKYPVIVMPVSGELAFKVDADIESEEGARRVIRGQASLLAISALGLPAVSLPMGFHEGLPVGVQIVSPLYREDICLDAAEAIEAKQARVLPVDPKF